VVFKNKIGVKHFGQREFNSMFCEHIECFIVRPGDTSKLKYKINVIMMLRGEGVRAMHAANFGMNYFE